MNEIIKGFQQFVNEGQGPAHQLYRKAAAYRTSDDVFSPEKRQEIHNDYADLKNSDPVEFDRFGKLATRLKGSLARDEEKARLKRVDAKKIAFAISNYFAYDNDTWPAELAHEFLNSDMSVDQLKSEMIERSGVRKNGEWMADQVIRYLKNTAYKPKS